MMKSSRGNRLTAERRCPHCGTQLVRTHRSRVNQKISYTRTVVCRFGGIVRPHISAS